MASDPSRDRMHPTRPGLVWPTHVDPTAKGGPTRAMAKGRHWRRTSWGLYVEADVELTVEQRILEAAAQLPEFGGITGWASLRWQGATKWFDGTSRGGGRELPVWLATAGDDIRPQPGVAVSAERLDPRDLLVVDQVAVTSAVRSVCFEMRYAPDVRAAVRVFDMAAYHDLVSTDEIAEYAARHSGWTGIPRCRGALPLLDENAWSPYEVDTRLTWRLDAELPPPLCNRPVFDRHGRHLGTPDLLDPEAGVVVEYEGSLHLLGQRRAHDLQREEEFRRVGLEYLAVVSADIADRAALAERMAAVRSRAAWAAEGRRDWTIDPPRWWTPTHTVGLRRALDPRAKKRVLRYRAA